MSEDQQKRLDPTRVWDEHAQDLYNFLVGLLRDQELAGEVSQATFARLIESLDQVRVESVRGWLFRVGFHEAMQRRRVAQRHRRLQQKVAQPEFSSATGPAELFEQKELTGRIRAALAELPPPQREVVIRRMYHEQTFAVIAAELNLPLGTVLSRMRSALKKLAATLSHEDEG